MYQLVIIAFPNDAAKIALINTEETENETTENNSWMCWGYQIVPTVLDVIDQTDNTIEKITMYGPQTYIEPFALNLKNETGIDVEIGEMK